MRRLRVVLAAGAWLAVGITPASEAGQALGSGGAGGAESTAPAVQTAPKVVEEGLFPKSIKIPGTDLSFGIGGYVKVDFIQDFSAIGDRNEFRINSIPVEGTAAAEESGATTIHARETRFNFDLRSEGSGGHHFRAFVEGDFFGDKNAFRMRHAFGEFGGLLGGQTWSTFQDISARPLTVDFEGPNGEVFLRTPMIRFTRKVNAAWTVAVAVENPLPQFSVPTGLAGAPRSTMPDIPGYVRYQRGAGHLQVAGMVRQIRFDSTDTSGDTSAAGWGVNLSFVVPTTGRDDLHGLFSIGKGNARYIEGFSGQNLDAVLSPAGALRVLRSQSSNLGYEHHWRANLRSGISFSTAFVEGYSGLSGDDISRILDFRVNLFYTPYPLVDFAGELLWGERRNQDRREGDAWRFQFAMIYRLN